MKAPASPSSAQRSSSWHASSTSSTFSMPIPLNRSGAAWQKSAIHALYARHNAESSSLSGRRYQNRPWLGCRHAPQTPSISSSSTMAWGSYAAFLTSSHTPRKSIDAGSSNRLPAWMTEPTVPTRAPSKYQASYSRPTRVRCRSMRGARARNFGSIRLSYRSGGSTMCESAEMTL